MKERVCVQVCTSACVCVGIIERNLKQESKSENRERGNGFFASVKAEVRFPDFNRMNLPLLVVP